MPPKGCWIGQVEPVFDDLEKEAVTRYLESGAWLTEHEKTRDFESAVARYVGLDYGIAMNNATSALYAGLIALGIGPDDEVICPDYTFIASATAISWTGAQPVFVDISMENLCLDLDLMEMAITPHTKAVMVVSLNGRAPDMYKASKIANEHNLFLVEDAAQSLGSVQNDKPLGTFGHFGVYSFSAIKILTTGQGGMLVTSSPRIADKVKQLKNFGRPWPGANEHRSIGYNFKFTDLQAVIGLEQFKKLPHRILHKQNIFSMYRDKLRDVEKISFLSTGPETSPWLVDILVPNRDALKDFLMGRGIHTRPMYPAIHNQPAYNVDGDFPNSDYVAQHGLWLPSSSNVKYSDIDKICDIIHEFYEAWPDAMQNLQED